MNADGLRELGIRTRREVMGSAHVDRALKSADPFAADFGDLAARYCWGEIWNRPGVDRRTRSIMNIGMLLAGNKLNELKSHIKGALNNGLAVSELNELLLQACIYLGVPAAGEAFKVAREAMDEREADLKLDHPVFVPATKVGFVGIGRMGGPMATVLAKAGVAIKLFDTNAANAAVVAEATGVMACATLEEVCRDVDVLITMLPDSTVVERVLLGGEDEAGAIKYLRQGAHVLDMSSSHPMRTRELAETLKASGIFLVDAPVSGGNKKAALGTLSIMVGGSDDDYVAVGPLIEIMGGQIFRVGPVGAGHAVKALNNYISGAGALAVYEAMHAAEAFGIDPLMLNRAVAQSSGRNTAVEQKVEQFILSGTFNSGFALSLMRKDVATAVSLVQDMATPGELARTVGGVFDRAVNRANGRAVDNTELYNLIVEQ